MTRFWSKGLPIHSHLERGLLIGFEWHRQEFQVVHILHREKREFYAIEALWSDAPRVDWQPGEGAQA